jgi:hypothetical protein
MKPHKVVSLPPLSVTAMAVAALVLAACGGGGGGGDMGPPPPAANTAPTISAIAGKVSDQDTVIGPIDFSIGDKESDAAMLSITATADSTSVIPADGITFAGSGAARTITLTPLEAVTGAVNVSIAVADPQGATTTRTFGVTVNAKPASVREWSLAIFAQGENDSASEMNGYTFAQDADDPAIYEPLIGAGEE